MWSKEKEELKNLNVLVVEDHNVVRAGIKYMLSNIEGFKIKLHECDGESEAIKRVGIFEYDVILLDIQLNNNSNGIEILSKIKKQKPNQKIIMLTMFNDSMTIRKCLDYGADGFILKNFIGEEINVGIQTVLSGRRYISNEASHILLEERADTDKNILSKREIEIVGYIADGFSTSEIGEKLNLSSRTIDSHRQNIYSKLGINKNIELVKYALKHKITK